MTNIKNIAKTVSRVKKTAQTGTNEERLRLWQQTCQTQGLSGEFVLSARLGQESVSEEQIRMIAALYGR